MTYAFKMLPAFGVQMCVRNIGPSNPWLIYSVPLPSTLNFKMKQICCLPLFLSFLWRNLLFQGTQSFLGFLATASILPCHLQNILSILCQDTNDISRHQSSAWARRFHKICYSMNVPESWRTENGKCICLCGHRNELVVNVNSDSTFRWRTQSLCHGNHRTKVYEEIQVKC